MGCPLLYPMVVLVDTSSRGKKRGLFSLFWNRVDGGGVARNSAAIIS